jgi:hypothetical protein
VVIGFILIYALAGAQQSSVVSRSPAADEVYLWGQGLPDGRNFDYVVSEEAFDRPPQWLPEEGLPPLAIARAIKIARSTIRADHPELADLKPWTIELTQASCRHKSSWFYVLSFYPVADPSAQTTITVVILMDGTVAKAREKKASSK